MSKIALSTKIDETLLIEVDKITKALKIPRNRALNEGLRLWIDIKAKEILSLEMKEASLATRKESLATAKDWEPSLADGLISKRSQK
jgi:hypothetical protein